MQITIASYMTNTVTSMLSDMSELRVRIQLRSMDKPVEGTMKGVSIRNGTVSAMVALDGDSSRTGAAARIKVDDIKHLMVH